MLREPFIKAFWLTFIVACGVFIVGQLAGCGKRNGLGGYDDPTFTPPARTSCVETATGLKCKSS